MSVVKVTASVWQLALSGATCIHRSSYAVKIKLLLNEEGPPSCVELPSAVVVTSGGQGRAWNSQVRWSLRVEAGVAPGIPGWLIVTSAGRSRA
jgi:hypothetical protein